MGIFNALIDIYDQFEDVSGVYDGDKGILAPVYHTIKNADITVVIDGDGNFKRAELVTGKGNEIETIIPITDKSLSSRTSGSIVPHPLCDELAYVERDFFKDSGNMKAAEKYEVYIEGLKEWSESDFTHPKVVAIYSYLSNRSLIKDIIDNTGDTILKVGKNNNLKLTSGSKKLEKIFVRFAVDTGEVGSLEELNKPASQRNYIECWKDKSLQDKYIEYRKSLGGKSDYSYLSGKMEVIAYKHPAVIRSKGGNSKLFSSNDDEGLTYRGRFTCSKEACVIGDKDSSKMHNVLNWLIKKHGIDYAGMTLIAFENNLNTIPDLESDTDAILKEFNEESDFELLEENNIEMNNTDSIAADKIKKSIWGQKVHFDLNSKIYILLLEASGKGRLAIQDYQEMSTSQYIENIQKWHKNCKWIHKKYEDGKVIIFKGMVSVKNAGKLLYGIEKGNDFALDGKEKIYKGFVKKWIQCILNGKDIPIDIVNLAVHRASSPVSFKNIYLWEQLLGLACSIVKYHRFKNNKEVWSMALDWKCTKRDYLYGRLLAIADRVEPSIDERGKYRETNAKRYMNRFALQPYKTWKVIEERINPYWSKLDNKSRSNLEKQLNYIYDNFNIEDFECNKPLDGLYLLGYHCQLRTLDMLDKKEESNND